MLRRDQGAEEAQLAHAADEEVRILIGVLERGGYRHHLGFHESPHGGDDGMRGRRRRGGKRLRHRWIG
jgi:hypothetical protein